ncbi:uncharacterized protein F5Z01DRAFT_636763 [Emericellopsis atlantica]|uniref:Uncharacterized protein n=1 Tax=Emericellopsis atlantica TaxID=2614577 RepID=A0A9P8CQV3_9HYPO|nr:uncharacterized protein F5Z01DRAFT_636763 [Emericellopsis atlantica]KAG9254101.1 hypothetical protein F5Z01DRAFT_636763 [Emericellopsis atlantica]
MLTAQHRSHFDSIRKKRKEGKGMVELLTFVDIGGQRFEKEWEKAIVNNKFTIEHAKILKGYFESWERMSDMISIALDDARTYYKKNGADFDVDFLVRYVETIFLRLKNLSKVMNEEIDKFREKKLL